MKTHYHYATVTDALNELKSKGFTIDFNLEENSKLFSEGRYASDEFEITEVYRYEGDTDPADETTVYGIESKSGIKGVIITSYGVYTSIISEALLKKLK